ncbi:hypothetical protein HPB51_024579 [Rhipicephalus microplus]|uniref:Tick transposon n=1 Tax=Rhipicephalus microplus TaxID=6941 RepID=A0A9J6DKW2_RHIMP|nr:hypothetical protein HPB51_024579 [Rhipicephalus microplus]
MGAHHTVEGLIEVNLSSRKVRISQTEQGRAVLRKIGSQIELQATRTALLEQHKEAVQINPLPRSMQPGKDERRQTARAKAVARQLEENPAVLYANASIKKHDDQATSLATSIDKLMVNASLGMTDTAVAEEVAVALALVRLSINTVVADSKSAYGSFCRGVISSLACAIISKHKPPRHSIDVVWVPAHSMVEGNAYAEHHTRELFIRADDEPSYAVTSFK